MQLPQQPKNQVIGKNGLPKYVAPEIDHGGGFFSSVFVPYALIPTLVVLSIALRTKNAKGEEPTAQLKQSFSLCMQQDGYTGAQLLETSPSNVVFTTEQDGKVTLNPAASTVTGNVLAWGKDKTRFTANYVQTPIEKVLPDTSAACGMRCWRMGQRETLSLRAE